MRSSSRLRCLPVEFWNFEKPDYSAVHEVSYNIGNLTSKSFLKSRKDVKPGTGRKNVTFTGKETRKIKPSEAEEKHINSILKLTKSTNADALGRTEARRRRNTNENQSPEVKENSIGTVGKKVKGKVLKNSEDPLRNINKSSTAIGKTRVNPAKIGKQDKLTLSRKATQVKRVNTVTESNDSGVTDLDGSYSHLLANETRNVGHLMEISNIYQGSRTSKVLKPLPNNSLLKVNKYARCSRNLKPPTFTDALSSTSISDGNISSCSPLNMNDNESGKGSIFKVPHSALKKSGKKGCVAEPNLEDIAEETVNETSCSNYSTADTPKKSNTLIRSRILNLGTNKEEGNESNTQNQDLSNAQQNDRSSTRKRKTAMQEKPENRKQEETLQNDTTLPTKVKEQLETTRRSSRFRKKPLEFWNFETAELKKLDGGEVSVVYSKLLDQSVVPSRSRNKSDQNQSKGHSSDHPALAKKGTTKVCNKKLNHLPLQPSSASKRKMFSPECNSLEETADFSDLPEKKRRKSLSRKSLELCESPIDQIKYETLQFLPWTTKDFTCYMARSYCDKSLDVYAGFIYLKKGQMLWSTTKQTTLCVISGKGSLKISDPSTEGTEVSLQENSKIVVHHDRKVCIAKEDGNELLKIFVVLQPPSTPAH